MSCCDTWVFHIRRHKPAEICYSALAERLVGNTDDGPRMWLAENLDATAAAYELTRVCTRAVPGNHVYNHVNTPSI